MKKKTNKQKVLLAFSGGLDTSYCTCYLRSSLGMEVHTAVVDTGGISTKQAKQLAQQSKRLGAASHQHLDMRKAFFDESIRYLIYGNVLRNSTYPLSVSAERIFQSIAIAQYANKIKANAIAHGSTGAGNDQVRFDVAFSILSPKKAILTPIRTLNLSRQQEVDYLQEQGIKMNWSKAKYSINKGMWGTSIGGAETLTAHQSLPEDAYPSKCTRQKSTEIEISFEKGIPVKINNKSYDPISLIEKLNNIGAAYAIGRDTHVGDTIIGIKGRIGFEAPAALLLIKAHQLLEKHTQTKWQYYWKEQVGNFYGMLLHEAQYFDPVMRDMEAYLQHTQSRVSGSVTIKLAPYRFELMGISSRYDLLVAKSGQYGETNNDWTSQDAQGFINIFANHLKNYHSKK